MLIVIRTGKDRRQWNNLTERVRDLEGAVEDFRNAIACMREDLDNYEHELSEEDAQMLDDLDGRLNSLDIWKADRHHTHKEPAREEPSATPAE
jgi:hypothetical protein